ncbi:hypothetical protein [Paenibacillus lautus]|uniref:hypothetical protein n=1 Tax=Paenibacillus lautus TaxID=1401 RepID=UPI003D270A60
MADVVACRLCFFPPSVDPAQLDGNPRYGHLVLMFFSMPLLNMAPEFLPQATQNWLYSWTPLRFAASALRDVMYFDRVSASSANAAVLWSVAGGFLVLLLASVLKIRLFEHALIE